jgi:anti-sigma regulatory factor (Ser/Thr protein kinase)
MIVFEVPADASGSTMAKAIDGFMSQHAGQLPVEVHVDLRFLKFIKPAAITMLANFCTWLSDLSQIRFDIPRPETSAVQFLDDGEFFLLIEGIQLRPGYQRRQSSIPLRELRGAQQFHWINNEMLTWLSPTIGISVAGLLPFATAVSELFNNVTDHSTAQSGWAFVQHFPKTGKVTISISDWGRGIPNEVRRVRRNISDAEAIIEATKQGFSSKGSPKKRGAGLDYLLTTVVGVNGGTVEIWSNFGHVLFARDRGRVSAYPQAFDAFSVGTTIDITFIVTNIVDVPDQAEEFEW